MFFFQVVGSIESKSFCIIFSEFREIQHYTYQGTFRGLYTSIPYTSKFTKTTKQCSWSLFNCLQTFYCLQNHSSCQLQIINQVLCVILSYRSFPWLFVIFVIFIIAFSYFIWINLNPLFMLPFRSSYTLMIFIPIWTFIIS